MKKYLLVIVGFVLGIVCTGYAAYKLKAEQVIFDNSNTGLNAETVQDGVDEIVDLLKYGTATASDIKEGKTALVNGEKITGNFESLKSSNIIRIKAVSTSTSSSTTFDFSDVLGFENLETDSFEYFPSYDVGGDHSYACGWSGNIYGNFIGSYDPSTGIFTLSWTRIGGASNYTETFTMGAYIK